MSALEAIRIKCPFCKAAKGQQCHSRRKKVRMTYFHAPRIHKWNRNDHGSSVTMNPTEDVTREYQGEKVTV